MRAIACIVSAPTAIPCRSRKTSRHRLQRLIDGIKTLADEVGMAWFPLVGGPGEIAVAGAGDIGHVIAMRGHPPQIGIALMRPDLKVVHQTLRGHAVRLLTC